METLFKQKLLDLRYPSKSQTFAEALLGDISWYKSNSSESSESEINIDNGYTEQKQVLESLERYAVERSTELKQNSIKFAGGEVVLKSEPDWSGPDCYSSFSELAENIKLESSFKNLLLKNKVPEKVSVIFVTEKLRAWEEVVPDLNEGLLNELLAGFVLKTAELFERMLVAMKLESDEVMIYPVEGLDGVDYSDDVLKIANFYSPQVLVTLGAKATQKVLNSKDRLSVIHGQFFPRKLNENHAVQVVPLFHPSVIETNLNMKKTTWADMQKIMKFLKKIP